MCSIVLSIPLNCACAVRVRQAFQRDALQQTFAAALGNYFGSSYVQCTHGDEALLSILHCASHMQLACNFRARYSTSDLFAPDGMPVSRCGSILVALPVRASKAELFEEVMSCFRPSFVW